MGGYQGTKPRNLPFTVINREILNSPRFTANFCIYRENRENCYFAKFWLVKNTIRPEINSQVPQLCSERPTKVDEGKMKKLYQNQVFAMPENYFVRRNLNVQPQNGHKILVSITAKLMRNSEYWLQNYRNILIFDQGITAKFSIVTYCGTTKFGLFSTINVSTGRGLVSVLDFGVALGQRTFKY